MTGVVVAAVGLGVAGCNAPPVERKAEVQRARETLAATAKAAGVSVGGQVLTMKRAEELALKNNLSLSVQRLALKLEDENVRLALAGGLPQGSVTYNYSAQSNTPMISQGGIAVATNDQRQQNLNVSATVPILDYGITYYAWQIAKDQRRQQRLVLARAEQTLVRDVRVAYARHASELRQEKLTDQTVQAAEVVLKLAQALERESFATSAETAVFVAALAQARVELSHARQRVFETRLVLVSLLGLDPGVKLVIDERLPTLPPIPTGELVKKWEEHALVVRPELAVQDLERHISANAVRKSAAEFFPRIDGIGSFNWTSNSMMVNPAYFLGGFQVGDSLLEGGKQVWRYREAKETSAVEKQRTVLISLGVLYDVELRALQMQQLEQTVEAEAVVQKARADALNRILSLYKEGLENEAGTARALAELNVEILTLDRAQTDYLTTWYALQAAVLMDVPEPTTQPASQPMTRPATQAGTRAATQSK